MDPNQQPTQPPQPPQPVPPAPTPAPAPTQPPSVPQPPSTYAPAAPQAGYDPNYLDSIAPPPPRPSFFSGSFGKIFFAMIGLFVLAVSIIIALSGQDQTADLQQATVRMDNMSKTAKNFHKYFKSNNLSNTNTNFQLWLTGNTTAAEDLLKKGGVKKTDYSKDMVAKEKKLIDDLNAKFEDARLNAKLNRVYASTMASETEKLINLLNTMGKKNKSSQIRDFAKTASNNLKSMQKSFSDYVDDGN